MSNNKNLEQYAQFREREKRSIGYWRDLGFDDKPSWLLVRNGIKTIEQLNELTDYEIRRLPGIGPVTAGRIREYRKRILDSLGSNEFAPSSADPDSFESILGQLGKKLDILTGRVL